jgi:hypothetical protein
MRHERKPSERFAGACLRLTSGLPTMRHLQNRPMLGTIAPASTYVDVS